MIWERESISTQKSNNNHKNRNKKWSRVGERERERENEEICTRQTLTSIKKTQLHAICFCGTLNSQNRNKTPENNEKKLFVTDSWWNPVPKGCSLLWTVVNETKMSSKCVYSSTTQRVDGPRAIDIEYWFEMNVKWTKIGWSHSITNTTMFPKLHRHPLTCWPLIHFEWRRKRRRKRRRKANQNVSLYYSIATMCEVVTEWESEIPTTTKMKQKQSKAE